MIGCYVVCMLDISAEFMVEFINMEAWRISCATVAFTCASIITCGGLLLTGQLMVVGCTATDRTYDILFPDYGWRRLRCDATRREVWSLGTGGPCY